MEIFAGSNPTADVRDENPLSLGYGDRDRDDNALRSPLREPPRGIYKKEQASTKLQDYWLRKPRLFN